MSFYFILNDKNFDFQMAHYESSQAQKILLQMRKDGGFSDIKLKASDDEIITAHKVKLNYLPGVIKYIFNIEVKQALLRPRLCSVFLSGPKN